MRFFPAWSRPVGCLHGADYGPPAPPPASPKSVVAGIFACRRAEASSPAGWLANSPVPWEFATDLAGRLEARRFYGANKDLLRVGRLGFKLPVD